MGDFSEKREEGSCPPKTGELEHMHMSREPYWTTVPIAF